MNVWLLGAGGFMAALLPAGVTAFRGSSVDRLVGLEMASVVLTLCMLVLAPALGQAAFVDLALALAVVSYGGGLVLARFLERWL